MHGGALPWCNQAVMLCLFSRNKNFLIFDNSSGFGFWVYRGGIGIIYINPQMPESPSSRPRRRPRSRLRSRPCSRSRTRSPRWPWPPTKGIDSGGPEGGERAHQRPALHQVEPLLVHVHYIRVPTSVWSLKRHTLHLRWASCSTCSQTASQCEKSTVHTHTKPTNTHGTH